MAMNFKVNSDFNVRLREKLYLISGSRKIVIRIYYNFKRILLITESFLVAQMVKCLPAMWETQVRSLGWEDLQEKETATHSSTLTWRIPRTEEPGRLQSMGSQRVGHDWATSLSLSFTFTNISDGTVETMKVKVL